MQLETQEFRAEAKFQRVSPQKARLVLELIKGRRVGEALETVIRCDPGYAAWMVKTLDGLQFSEAALDLLAEIHTAAGRES